MNIKSILFACMTIQYIVSIVIIPGNIAKPRSDRLVFGQIAKINAIKQSGTVSIERKSPPKMPHDSEVVHNP